MGSEGHKDLGIFKVSSTLQCRLLMYSMLVLVSFAAVLGYFSQITFIYNCRETLDCTTVPISELEKRSDVAPRVRAWLLCGQVI